ncbi:MAG: histidine phosphatase family protein [Fimbriimonadales bacterium]
MRVYLVRHGQTAWNAEQRAQGHTDVPLDEEGTRQAELLVTAFEQRPFSRILTSDLQRARATAKPLAEKYGVKVEERTDLRERTFGEWEGQPFEMIAKYFIEQELLTGKPREEIQPPDGESQADVWRRVEKVAQEIEAYHEPQVVISHGGSCSLLLSRLLRGTMFTARSFRFDNTGITTIARRPDGGYHLIRYNESSHLRRPALISGSVDGTVQ